jgi:hypothetical protein
MALAYSYVDFDVFKNFWEFFRIYYIPFGNTFHINRINHTQCSDIVFQQLGQLYINHKSSRDVLWEYFPDQYFVIFFLVILKKQFYFKFDWWWLHCFRYE